uniref:Uncharacterized protein n=1 Tax=Globisporangium ultimum (strain ATCC 200006 / CBS 805.95 / DAOM BR144) TaxID=431595 RepID=K3WAX4_GLOUD
RQIPFLSFSSCGTRIEEVSHTGAYFDCVVRRVYEERKSTHDSHSSYTILWKTTASHQHIISDKWRRESDTAASASDSQWKEFEDPFATVCFVLEPRFTTGVDERDLDGINLSFWFQVLGPATKESALVEAAKHIETKYRGLDAFLQKASSDRSRLTPSALFENDKTECGLLARELP